MALPMDNMFFRYFLRYWPVLLAVIVSALLIYQWTRPKVNAEKLTRGIIKQNILTLLEERTAEKDSDETRDWLDAREKMDRYVANSPILNSPPAQHIQYRSYITVSLIWTLFWIGVEAFLVIRICFVPYYYGSEAVFLGCFTYYIVIGLISYFRR